MALRIQHWFFVRRHQKSKIAEESVVHLELKQIRSESPERPVVPARISTPSMDMDNRSSVMSFHAPGAPVKKSQRLTLGDGLKFRKSNIFRQLES